MIAGMSRRGAATSFRSALRSGTAGVWSASTSSACGGAAHRAPTCTGCGAPIGAVLRRRAFCRAARGGRHGICRRSARRQDRRIHPRARIAAVDEGAGNRDARAIAATRGDDDEPARGGCRQAERPARDHLRRRQLAVCGRGRGRAARPRAWCCLRSAAGPMPRRSSGIRITGFALGQAGRFRRLARAEGCRDVVFIGTLVRPPMRQDAARLADHDACCRASCAPFAAATIICCRASRAMFERQGFRLVGAARGGAGNSGAAKARSAAIEPSAARPRRHRARACAARRDRAVRRRAGRGRRRQSRAGGRGGRRHR